MDQVPDNQCLIYMSKSTKPPGLLALISGEFRPASADAHANANKTIQCNFPTMRTSMKERPTARGLARPITIKWVLYKQHIIKSTFAWWRLAARSRNVAVSTTTPFARQTDKYNQWESCKLKLLKHGWFAYYNLSSIYCTWASRSLCTPAKSSASFKNACRSVRNMDAITAILSDHTPDQSPWFDHADFSPEEIWSGNWKQVGNHTQNIGKNLGPNIEGRLFKVRDIWVVLSPDQYDDRQIRRNTEYGELKFIFGILPLTPR